MRFAALALAAAACSSPRPPPSPTPHATCRTAETEGVTRWLDADSCKTALLAPCPDGSKLTHDSCGCYCLATP